ncbi:hypothetical protein [Microcoleus sp. herbarium2]|uniref:hypothetical protein n=1 Tax=Microcoleus sp. herbarium2 TaxID=3055433 RepID=UPI002FD2C750
MTEPTPTPETQNSPVAPDEKNTSSPPERDGFFRRVRRELNPEPVHPSEAEEIVIMPGEGAEPNEGT